MRAGGHGDRAQASQLHPDLGVPGGPHGRRAGARTAAELALAFKLPISPNIKLLLLLFLAIWKAALVGLFFMHLKFERWNLRIMAIIPLPLAVIFILAGMSEHIW